MSNINLYNLNIAQVNKAQPQTQSKQTANTPSFDSVFKAKLAQSGVNFTKHAASRIDQRGIDVSEDKIERLNKGMEMARDKGLEDVLVLVDRTAFIVNAKSSTVITTVGDSDNKGSVFTNIQGTVII